MIKQEYVKKDEIKYCNEKKEEVHMENRDFFRMMLLLVLVFFCFTSLRADDRDKNDQRDVCVVVKNV